MVHSVFQLSSLKIYIIQLDPEYSNEVGTISSIGLESEMEDLELPSFDLASINTATNNFCVINRIGTGSFGPVFKVTFDCKKKCVSYETMQGSLSIEQEVAVKWLSKNSGQGQEFKNEIFLIAKLQHKNLVKLLGCCIQGRERISLYEYMSNKSLDYFISV